MGSSANGGKFDVIVVGAGSAGLGCAATLALEGAKVALICETPDVAWNLRPKVVDGNIGFVQHPLWQSAWGGGYWYPLARRLNLPIQFEFSPPLSFVFLGGEGGRVQSMLSLSARGIVETVQRLSPIPLGDDAPELERLLKEALQTDWRELSKLHTVPLHEWLEERKAPPMVQAILFVLAANLMETSAEIAASHISVWGLFSMLRGAVCGEAPLTTPVPETRAALLVPIAEAIEGLGGTISRGTKASQLMFENGRAVGVALEDGTEFRADRVAIATGTNRVPALLPEMPTVVREAVDYAASLPHEDVCKFAVLDRPVIDLPGLAMVAGETGSCVQMWFPMHRLAPWGIQPGKQMLITQSFWPKREFEAAGGPAPIIERMDAITEQHFPGYMEATVATATQSHRHHWLIPLSCGPKLPRTTEELPHLWFVGDSSVPLEGILGIEGAMGAGVMGARGMLASLKN